MKNPKRRYSRKPKINDYEKIYTEWKTPIDLSKATAVTIDELRKAIQSNRLVTIQIQIN